MQTTIGNLQFIWWGFPLRLWRLKTFGPFPSVGPSRGSIYRWQLMLGPVEIRRWSRNGRVTMP